MRGSLRSTWYPREGLIEAAIYAEATPLPLGGEVSGRIDTTDTWAEFYYRVTVYEPGILTLNTRGDADVALTVFDPQRNVSALSRGRAAMQMGADQAALQGGIVVALPVAGQYLIRVAGVGSGAYVLSTFATAYALKKLSDFAEIDVDFDGEASYDLKPHFDGEETTEAAFDVSASVRTRWGPLNIGIGTDYVVRIRHVAGAEVPCGTGTDRSLNIKMPLTVSWMQLGLSLKRNVGELSANIVRHRAPRRKGANEITVSVPTAGTGTVPLTDFIEDPDGGPLTFAVRRIPSGWGATTSGGTLALTAGAGAADGSMTVTATDRDGECWNFPVRVSVGGGG